MTSRVLCRVNRLLEQAAGTRPVLGLDTSTSIASLALIARGKVAASLERSATSHGAALPAAIDELVGAAGLSIHDVGAIAVGTGPGSFTGLRIGLSYAKGIAMASGCALVGIPSFDAMALSALERHNTDEGRLVCVVVDARKGEVYAALYRVVADGLQKLSEELVIALEHLASRITEDVMFVGDERAKDAAALVKSRGHWVAGFDTGMLDLRGVCVAALGGARFARGETDRAASIEPLYIRTPEATFKPTSKNPAGTGTEGVWSIEKKNSFGSI
ncbi:tRNA (adenosine(37)-N6)-threonylcarbamoyltransferase complex dimerization subunit type 1 TsaB [Candidatus Binatus sp.]|uniref:tRNA (adenosine(37)-N6)-threonylcarbamoyltransferase complex dimerization subunit type 1 TsaB n=1 Tax=Candidatus Binatus sp. TaxID=2811406 RepID=UPI003CC58AF3